MMNNLETGKLYIKFINHKLTFHVLPYNTKKSYQDNLVTNSKNAYRQTPIVSLRLINLIELILLNGYKVKNLQQANDVPYNISNMIISTPDLKTIIDNLTRLDDKGELNISSMSFENISINSQIIIRDNGLISVDKAHFTKVTSKIDKYLDYIELAGVVD